MLALLQERKKRNFKNPNLKEVKTIEEAQREIYNKDYVKLIVHNYDLRCEIRRNFRFTYDIKTITQKGVNYNIDSTIAYHKACKKATLFRNLLEEDNNIICPHCKEVINNDLYLSTKDNVIILRRIKYFVHTECGKRNKPEELHWFLNDDCDCYDTFCNHCYEKICFSCRNEDNTCGYTIIF